MLSSLVAVGLGGALGAMARYLVSLMAQNAWGIYFPFGTLIVNGLGSFLAGLTVTLLVNSLSGSEQARLFIFTGFLGGFTTFSSFAVESMWLFEQGQWIKWMVNIAVNNIAALGLVLFGAMLGRMSWGN